MNGLTKISHTHILAVMAGGLIALYVAWCMTLPLKFTVVFVGALALPFLSLLAGKYLEEFILFVMVMVLPLNIGRLLGARPPYEWHIGGAPVEGLEMYLVDILLAALLIIWALRSANRELSPPARFRLMDLFFFGFLLCAALSLLDSAKPLQGVKELIRWCRFYLYFFYIANALRRRGQLKVLLTALILGLFIQACVCFNQYMTGRFFDAMGRSQSEIIDRFKGLEAESQSFTEGTSIRAGGTVGPLNVQAMYFGLLLPVCLSLALCLHDPRLKLLNALCYVAGVGGVILTFSRGGLLNISASSAVVIALTRHRRLINARTIGWLILIVMLGVGSFMAAFPGTAKRAITRATTFTREISITPRTETLKSAFIMIRREPFFGVGMNQFGHTSRDLIRDVLYREMPVHNRFVLFASEIGIPGALFYTAFLISGMAGALRILRRFQNPLVVPVCIGSLAALAGAVVHMQVDLYDVYIINVIIMALLAIPRAMEHFPEAFPEDENAVHGA